MILTLFLESIRWRALNYFALLHKPIFFYEMILWVLLSAPWILIFKKIVVTNYLLVQQSVSQCYIFANRIFRDYKKLKWLLHASRDNTSDEKLINGGEGTDTCDKVDKTKYKDDAAPHTSDQKNLIYLNNNNEWDK